MNIEIIEDDFTREALVSQIDDDGNYLLKTIQGENVLIMIHPVQISEHKISSLRIKQFKADLSLHQNALPMYDCLKEFQLKLQLLKDGKISIFDFPIDTLLQQGKNTLKRASEIS